MKTTSNNAQVRLTRATPGRWRAGDAENRLGFYPGPLGARHRR
jgi:hypothetical protein